MATFRSQLCLNDKTPMLSYFGWREAFPLYTPDVTEGRAEAVNTMWQWTHSLKQSERWESLKQAPSTQTENLLGGLCCKRQHSKRCACGLTDDSIFSFKQLELWSKQVYLAMPCEFSSLHSLHGHKSYSSVQANRQNQKAMSSFLQFLERCTPKNHQPHICEVMSLLSRWKWVMCLLQRACSEAWSLDRRADKGSWVGFTL